MAFATIKPSRPWFPFHSHRPKVLNIIDTTLDRRNNHIFSKTERPIDQRDFFFRSCCPKIQNVTDATLNRKTKTERPIDELRESIIYGQKRVNTSAITLFPICRPTGKIHVAPGTPLLFNLLMESDFFLNLKLNTII